ncbi:Rrf2 family transcriptional regulator [Clostridium sp. AN503]|jgi:Rrf2 family protein|uniref:RrF2 family transcriptional regulator n=1 Tax=Clostridium sp. AN503 TaxID=3160598 RepID=UPI00345A5211
MLFTKESDYAIRIVRALKSGEKRNIREICELEQIPEAFAYKITRKLNRAGLVSIRRGAGGGYVLGRPIHDITLYDVITAIEPDFAVLECIHHFCDRQERKECCKVHHEMLKIQNTVEALLKARSLDDILEK